MPPRKVQYHFPVIAKGVLQMALIIKPMYPERFLRDMNYTPALVLYSSVGDESDALERMQRRWWPS